MSSTTQVTNFQDLYTDLLNRIRADTSQTATVTQAKRYINIALQDMALGFDYKMPWLERMGFIETHAPYTDGTVSIVVGSQTLTGVGTLWNTNNSYSIKNARNTGKIVIAGGTNIYDVTTVVSDTSITLSPKYVDTADIVAQTYTYFEDEYDLAADFLRPLDFREFSDIYQIPLEGRQNFRRMYPRPNISGRPRVATILDFGFSGNTTPVRRVKFFPYPNNVYVIPYAYITNQVAVTSAGVGATGLSGDIDEPTVPLRYRHAIIFHALYHWYRDKRDDTRSQEAKAEYTDIMLRVAADQEISAPTKSQIQPRVGMYAWAAKRPYRRGARSRYSINNEFDRFERY